MVEKPSTERTFARLREALGASRWNVTELQAMIQAHLDKHSTTGGAK